MVHDRDHVQTDGTLFLNCDDDGADEDDSVGNGDDGGADNGADGAEKHLVHLPQVADCCLAEISKQNKNSDNGGEDDSVCYGNDGGADNGADGAEKHL
eukprot:10433089-Ditylum_brightwellii.AAC.1